MKFEGTPKQSSPGRRRISLKSGFFWARILAGLSPAAQGVEGKEAQLSPGRVLINMQQDSSPGGMHKSSVCVRLECEEPRPNSPAFQRMPHLLAQAESPGIYFNRGRPERSDPASGGAPRAEAEI